MISSKSLTNQVYRLRVVLVALSMVALGLVALVLTNWLDSINSPHLVVALCAGLSDALIVTGAIGLAVDFFTGRDKDLADTERTRSVLKELTPDFTDAVLKGFASSPEDLRRVATPALLDDIATNALSLRLDDEQFAREIYADVRDQAIRAPERWYDVDVNVRLSTAVERSTNSAPRFDVLVEWEYTVTPSHPVARFACVSDRDEFYELTSDVPATSTWFMTPRPGFDASERNCFELLSYSVDGKEQKIRRSERTTGQTYSVTLGNDLVREGRPVRIRHLYRVATPQFGHRLFFELPQPARDVSLSVDYTNTDIATLSVSDLVSSIQKPRVARLPAGTGAKVVQVDIDGWLLPRAGFTCVWTLESEISVPGRSATSASSSDATAPWHADAA